MPNGKPGTGSPTLTAYKTDCIAAKTDATKSGPRNAVRSLLCGTFDFPAYVRHDATSKFCFLLLHSGRLS